MCRSFFGDCSQKSFAQSCLTLILVSCVVFITQGGFPNLLGGKVAKGACTRQIWRVADILADFCHYQRKRYVFSERFWKLILVCEISMSIWIRKVEKIYSAESTGFFLHSRSFQFSWYWVKNISLTPQMSSIYPPYNKTYHRVLWNFSQSIQK